jgi:hypothetical protein
MTSTQRPFRGRLVRLSGLTVLLACVVIAAPAFAFASRSTHGIWVPKFQKGAVSTNCPSGERVAFGGLVAQWDPANDSWVLPTGMRRTAIGQWSVYGQSLSSSHGSRLTAVAYCDSTGPSSVAQTTVSVASHHVGSAVATCPIGTVVVAGGFNTRGLPYAEVMKGLERTTNTTWRATILNIGQQATTITSIAYCGPGPAPTLQAAQIPLASEHNGTARATCPIGTELVFGGFVETVGWSNTLPHIVPFSWTADNTTRWAVAASNGGSVAGTVTSLAYCR